ncbi:hypothetical protein TNIN_264291 [Trichonephila inaurata madagascariensis]|uniref:Endonuclease/exonuclease/phosphatase domain-containing protein n=1 Tax=Trichonephila inaurata madagascariensis TaxID=2747483 RepID=A0A8X6XKB0_9ARAC|nr:hypothetical protein TNIN_264291 [Trichonephila inaurata madagascariensis]
MDLEDYDPQQGPSTSIDDDEPEFCDFIGDLELPKRDFNASYPVWGCDYTDLRGDALLDYILRNNRKICNILERGPTFVARSNSSGPDIIHRFLILLPVLNKWEDLGHESRKVHKFISVWLRCDFVDNGFILKIKYS